MNSTQHCRCKAGSVRVYLAHANPSEGDLVVDHEPVDETWHGGLCIERRWTEGDKKHNDFVMLDAEEVGLVRDALNAYLFDHTP